MGWMIENWSSVPSRANYFSLYSVQTVCVANPVCYQMGSIPTCNTVKWQGAKFTLHLQLMPRLWMHGPIFHLAVCLQGFVPKHVDKLPLLLTTENHYWCSDNYNPWTKQRGKATQWSVKDVLCTCKLKKANICSFHAASESEVRRLTRDTFKHSGIA